ncbi:MAG TPA: GNAT family N-acetyltransferase [Vicinamibacterales bacterium]|nr:GNAT family N-acetyltransferase [Vicinamibacterales bacterium]
MSDSQSPADLKLDEALQVPTAFGPVIDNRAKHRFELQVNGSTAFLVYERTDDALTLIHTEVPPALRGHHVGDAIVEAVLRAGHSAGLRIIPVCPFVRAYLRKHPSAL